MARKKRQQNDHNQMDLLEWAAAQPWGQVIDARDHWRPLYAQLKARRAAVRAGKWPERAFHREEPADIVELRKQA